MTFAAGFFGICVFATLAFLVVIAWRQDRRERLNKPCSETAAGQDIPLAEWDPLADLLEDAARRRDLIRRLKTNGTVRDS